MFLRRIPVAPETISMTRATATVGRGMNNTYDGGPQLSGSITYVKNLLFIYIYTGI